MMLAWAPFIDPIDVHALWWVLLVPMSFFVALSYRAVRVRTFERFWLKVCVLTTQMVVGMIALGAVTYLLVELLLPMMPMTW